MAKTTTRGAMIVMNEPILQLSCRMEPRTFSTLVTCQYHNAQEPAYPILSERTIGNSNMLDSISLYTRYLMCLASFQRRASCQLYQSQRSHARLPNRRITMQALKCLITTITQNKAKQLRALREYTPNPYEPIVDIEKGK